MGITTTPNVFYALGLVGRSLVGYEPKHSRQLYISVAYGGRSMAGVAKCQYHLRMGLINNPMLAHDFTSFIYLLIWGCSVYLLS